VSEEVTARSLSKKVSWFSRNDKYLLPSLLLAIILVIWELVGQGGHISQLFFSWPSAIAQSMRHLAATTLVADLRISGIEFAIGLLIALATAIPLGMMVGYWRRVEHSVDPLVSALYATPTVALMPLFVIWFGLGITSKVAVVAVLAFFPVLISTTEGVKTVDPVLLGAVRSFGAGQRQVFTVVVLPATLPFIMTGIRLAIGKALIGVVIGEFIGAQAGIGFRIREAAETFRTADFLASIVVLMIAAVLLNGLLRVIEQRLARWRVAR
jgi:NitT/TauT family transport system permease protein